MTPDIKPLVAGNWKMNGFRSSIGEIEAMDAGYDVELRNRIDLLVCVPATLLHQAAHACVGSGIEIGGQDCHVNSVGAHTGDISAEMIADAGGTAVIVGHSERRADHGETNEIVKAKAEAGLRGELSVIVCVGETENERNDDKTLEVIKDQLAGSLPNAMSADNVIVAYEPVWAIGTGRTPTAAEVGEVHSFMRSFLVKNHGASGGKTRLLYGGSVKPGNAVELMGIANVDGALVGGASLKAADFLGICEAYRQLT